MADFDPDKFISETSNIATATDQGGFDPDKFIAETGGGEQPQPAHVQNLMSRLGPLLMSGAKAAVGPRFVQAGKDIAANAAARSARTERAPTLPEEAWSGLGEAAGLAMDVLWQPGKAAIGTTADALKSITPQPVQQAIQPAAQATESGLQKVVRGIGNIPLPGGNKVSDIPVGAQEWWKQQPQRTKDFLTSTGDVAMVAPVGKGTQLLAKGAEKVAPAIVEPIAEATGKVAALPFKASGAVLMGAGKKTLKTGMKIKDKTALLAGRDVESGVKKIVDDIDKYKVESMKGYNGVAKHAQEKIDAHKSSADDITFSSMKQNPQASANIEGVVQGFIDDLEKPLSKEEFAALPPEQQAFRQGSVDPKLIGVGEEEEAIKAAKIILASLQKRFKVTGDLPLDKLIEAKRILGQRSFKKGAPQMMEEPFNDRVKEILDLKVRDEAEKIAPEIRPHNKAIHDLITVKKAAKQAQKRVGNKNVGGLMDWITALGISTSGGLLHHPIEGVALGAGAFGARKVLEHGRGAAALMKTGRALSDVGKKLSGQEEVIARMKGEPVPQPTGPASIPVGGEGPIPQGTMQTQFIPGQEPGAPVPKPGIPQTIKNLGNEGGYIDLGGASAPVEPPPTAPKGAPGAAAKTPQQELIDKIRGEKPQYTPEQVESVARFQTEQDAAMKEIAETKDLPPDELELRKTNKRIDLFRKHGILWDEGRQRYVFNSQQPDVNRFWDSFGYPGGEEGLAVSQRSEELRAEIEANLASENLPRENAAVPPVEGAPSQVGEVAQGESEPPQDVLPQGSETEPQSSLSPEDQATQDRLTRIAERKERKPGEVYTHELTGNPQANRVLWRDNVRRQVKWHIDHNPDGTLRDDRKEQWAYITGETTDKTGAPIYPTDRTKKVLGAHSFEFGMEDYGPGAGEQLGDETRLTSEDAAGYWVQDLGQPEGEMPTTWDEIRQEIMSAEKSRGQAERVAKGHVAKAGKVEDGGEEAQYAAEQDERKSEEASHEEQAAIEGERGSMQNVIDMLKGESGAIATGGKVADPLYSNAAKAVESISMPKAPASQWLSMLDPAKGKGTKADEMKWIGLDDFLKEKGDQSVTKQEIQDFIDQNKVQLEEVVKGKAIVPEFKVVRRHANDSKIWNAVDENGKNIEGIGYDEDGEPYSTGPMAGWGNSEQEAIEDIKNKFLEGGTIKSFTKFSSYQLPGGENYREVLLRLPGEYRGDLDAINEKLNTLTSERNKVLKETNGDIHDERITKIDNEMNPLIRERNRIGELKKPDYKSPHWDEPNVLAHMRLNDRVDADGKKVLFIEEIQSDWHQAGRKRGYRISGDEKKAGEILAKMEAMERANRGKGGSVVDLVEYQKLNDELDAVSVKNSEGVPAAPFSKTWHELAFKRILREAAEKGYDKVAWTTGEQQAARYDLSKQISKVTYQPKNETLVAYDIEGRKVIDESGVAPEKIEDYIGKDPAKKLLEQPVDDKMGWTAEEKHGGFVVKKPDGKYYEINNRLFVGTKAQTEGIIKRNAGVVEQSIEGQDLKVGGEGMKGFYDKILVDYANKYGKKWGAKVEDTKFGSDAPSYDEIQTMLEDFDKYPAESNERKALRKQQETAPDIGHDSFRGVQHSMTITPAMRASVMGEGQPMFAVTGGAGIAGTLAAMQASRDKNKKGVSDVVSRMKSKRK